MAPQNYLFVVETDVFLKQRLRVLIPLVVFTVGVAAIFLFSPLAQAIDWGNLIKIPDIGSYSPTPIGLLFTGFIGGLFFFPLPQELFYSTAVSNGGAWSPLLLGVLSGTLLAQVVNYLLGWKLNSVLVSLLDPKKLYGARRWVGKFGVWAVFAMNVLPLPSPLLHFALGIVRYNTTRLFIVMTFATIIKFGVITWMVV